MISLIFNNLSDSTVAHLLLAYKAAPDYDPGQTPSVSLAARDYLTLIDNPMVGAANINIDPNPGSTLMGLEPVPDDPSEFDAASAFAAPAEAVADLEPIIERTPKMGSYTMEEMYEAGHTNESLAAEGYITITYPAARAPAPKPAAAPSPKPSGAPPAPDNGGSTVGAVTLDKDGVPWDERIHSGGRTRTKDERWTKKKGVDAALYASITEELRVKHVEPFTPLNGVAVESAKPAAPPPPAAKPAAPPPPAAKPAAPGPAAVANSAHPATTVGAEKPFLVLCKLVTDPVSRFSAATIVETCEQFGSPGLGSFARPEFASLIEEAYQAFRSLLVAR